MLAQAPSYFVDALSEEVHIWGNSDSGFSRSITRIILEVFALLTPVALRICFKSGGATGVCRARSLSLRRFSLLVAFQAYLVSRQTQEVSVARDRFGCFQLFKKGAKNPGRYLVLQFVAPLPYPCRAQSVRGVIVG
jgi:hypothetical protein